VITSKSLSQRLLECKYDIFKKLALEKLNYRVILPGDHIVTPSNVGQYNQMQALIKKQML
jgi:hypothetical protein